MNSPHGQTISCPACGRAQPAPVLPILDADADLARKRSLVEGRYPALRCVQCGQQTRINSELIYVDATARLVVWCVPDASDERAAPTLPDAIQATLDRAIGLFTLRRVGTIVEMIEKVLIHDEGMDDRLVEAMKLVAGSQLVRDGRAPTAPLLFGGRNRRTDGTTSLDLVTVTAKGVQTLSGPFEEMYEELAARLAGALIVARPAAGVFARVDHATARQLLKQAQD